MPDEKDLKTFDRISGGQRQDLEHSEIPEDAWWLIKNMEYGRDGSLKSRGGQVAYNGSALAGTLDNGIRYYRNADSSATLIVSAFMAANTKIYKGNDSTGVLTEITGGTALGNNLPISWTVFKDTLLLANGTQEIQYYTTGTTKADCVYSDNNRKGKYLAVADRRVWLAGDPGEKNRVYVSEFGFWSVGPGTDCSFPTNNYIDVPGKENDYITGLAAYGDEIYVFRTKDIFYIYGEDVVTWGMSPVVDDIGAVGQKAICVTPLGILFASDATIWWFDPGRGDLKDVGLMAQDTLDGAVLSSAAMDYYPSKGRIHISFKASSASTVNDTGLVFEPLRMRMYENTIGAADFVSNDGGTDDAKFYRLAPDTTGAAKGIVYQMDTGTQDAGEDFTCELRTKHFSFIDRNVIKHYRSLYMDMYARTDDTPMSVTAILDRGAAEVGFGSYEVGGMMRWGELVFGEDKYGGGLYQNVTKRFPFQNRQTQGRQLQLYFTKTNEYAFTLYGFSILFDERELRRR